ncbi:MAG: S49 family peptidase [Myxococcales bacterium]|nr:S49 family peptidase [Myxococcales bacterium]
MLIRLIRNLIVLALALAFLPLRLLRLRARPAYVRFRIKGDPPYREAGRRRLFAFRQRDPAQVTSLEALRRQLSVLRGDPKVRGAVFEVDGFRGPAAKREAISQLIAGLRGFGKEAVAFAVGADTAEYELLCACDRIVLSPAGRLELTGFAAEAIALGAGLKRAGIGAHFVRRGEHKTAPELFTREEVSEIQRRTLEAILDERYAELLKILESRRRLPPEEAARRVDGGPYGARSALSAGLVDALSSLTELGKLLAGEGDRPSEKGEPPEARIDHFPSYAATRAFPPFAWKRLRRRPRVSVVPVSGIIAHGDGGGAPIGPVIAGSESVSRALRAARRDRSRSVLLYVSSPGGSAIASELILEEVRRTARKKPVVAFFDRVAASGGYMAALGAKEIWAAPQAIAGSIGVFAGKLDFSGLIDRLGVRHVLVSRGANAGIYSALRPFSEAERASLERDVEETYQAFLEHAAAARGRTKEEIHARAEGRVYSGRAALEAGLVDRLGSFEDACRRSLELAGRVDEFDIVLHGPMRRRLSPLTLLQHVGTTVLWGLMDPLLPASLLGDAEAGP